MLSFCKNQDFLSSCLLAITITLYYINLSFYSSPSIHYQTTSSFFSQAIFQSSSGHQDTPIIITTKYKGYLFILYFLTKYEIKVIIWQAKIIILHHHSLSWHKNSKELSSRHVVTQHREDDTGNILKIMFNHIQILLALTHSS